MSSDALPRIFHDGELAVQARMGVVTAIRPFAERAIRDFMPDQHRDFFAQLPFILVGALDGAGRPWATAAFGAPGFVSSPEPHSLAIRGTPLLSPDVGLRLGAGDPVGLLGLEPPTRRRNRMNGTITDAGGALVVAVRQSFGNCKKFIHARDLAFHADAQPGPLERMRGLSPRARALVANADTLYIASRSPHIDGGAEAGLDVSHRGGRPGFVRAGEDGRISFPDFAGNNLYNTAGNIVADGRVGLFFADFDTGDALFVTGQATIDWDGPRVAALDGAMRIFDVEPVEAIYAPGILPMTGPLTEPSPVAAATGIWR
mgnify:CR=1 FL=1